MGWGDAALAALSGDFAGAVAQAGAAAAEQDVIPENSNSAIDYSGGGEAGSADNLGRYPMPGPVAPYGQSSGGGAQRDGSSGGGTDIGALVFRASLATGKSLSKKTIVAFLMKWGWQIASCAFQLQQQELLQVFVAVKAKPAKKRGPHLYTVLKRIRLGQRYTKMLAKVAVKAGAITRRKPSSSPASRRVITLPARRKAK